MNKCDFYDYIVENFFLDGTSRMLVNNILNYVEAQGFNDDEERTAILDYLLDGIGLEYEEIQRACF